MIGQHLKATKARKSEKNIAEHSHNVEEEEEKKMELSSCSSDNSKYQNVRGVPSLQMLLKYPELGNLRMKDIWKHNQAAAARGFTQAVVEASVSSDDSSSSSANESSTSSVSAEGSMNRAYNRFELSSSAESVLPPAESVARVAAPNRGPALEPLEMDPRVMLQQNYSVDQQLESVIPSE